MGGVPILFRPTSQIQRYRTPARTFDRATNVFALNGASAENEMATITRSLDDGQELPQQHRDGSGEEDAVEEV